MLVSFTTGIVLQQAYACIELETELTQMRQRQTWTVRHRHCLRRILRHPDRQLRQRAIGLTDGHSHVVTTAIATSYDDRLPVTGMKSVTDNRLTQLIVSIMKLS